MSNQELIDFIHTQIRREKTQAQITSQLSEAGWHAGDIEEAFLASQNKPDTSIQSLPSVDVLVHQALQLYSSEFKRLTEILLVSLLMRVGVFGVAFAGLLFVGAFGVMLKTSPSWLLLVLLLVVFGLNLFVQAWSDLALLTGISKKTRAFESFHRTRFQIFPFMAVSILSGLATLGGIFLFVVPGIVISVWILFAQFIFINEDKRGLTAIYQSREYVRGRWGEVAGKFIVMPVILGGISLLLSLTIIFSGVFGNGRGIMSIIFTVVAYLFSSLIVPAFGGAYTYIMYQHVKRRVVLPSQTTGRTKWLVGGSVAVGTGLILLIIGVVFLAISVLKQNNSLTTIVPFHPEQETLSIIQSDLALYYNRHGMYPDYLVEVLPLAGQADRQVIRDGIFNYSVLDHGQNYRLCLKLRPTRCVVSHQPIMRVSPTGVMH